jgi:hypothetical protein
LIATMAHAVLFEKGSNPQNSPECISSLADAGVVGFWLASIGWGASMAGYVCSMRGGFWLAGLFGAEPWLKQCLLNSGQLLKTVWHSMSSCAVLVQGVVHGWLAMV